MKTPWLVLLTVLLCISTTSCRLATVPEDIATAVVVAPRELVPAFSAEELKPIYLRLSQAERQRIQG